VALVFPAPTVTDPGRLADEELLFSLTTRPPFGAGAVIVTVPTEELPPVTVEGERLTEAGVMTLIVRIAVFATEPLVALIVACACLVTAFVVTAKVAEDFPLGTVTEAGTTADRLLLDN
jgi:hypothetical protein